MYLSKKILTFLWLRLCQCRSTEFFVETVIPVRSVVGSRSRKVRLRAFNTSFLISSDMPHLTASCAYMINGRISFAVIVKNSSGDLDLHNLTRSPFGTIRIIVPAVGGFLGVFTIRMSPTFRKAKNHTRNTDLPSHNIRSSDLSFQINLKHYSKLFRKKAKNSKKY